MKKLLIVVDMQTDFVTGALGTKEAQAIVPMVAEKIKKAKEDGTDVIFTLDTHEENYLDTQEGKQLPVPHCIKNTEGWMLVPQLRPLAGGCMSVEKPTFGSTRLAHIVGKAGYDEIELIGLCTDICVISNAMILKASVPETPISVDASCCAGVTPESHANALAAMKMCQITITE
ncbi:MAG: cysteine hydrolase family protein [Lachnospiraceae bacterium]|nr:cysteine hydrolase [Lachnospiraceae bacterium]MDD6618143.1 cysteine hydrolase [Clostridiales bacterium]